MTNEFFLNIINISKAFPGVQALKGINLSVKKGIVLALAGENGAGKSTLMKILSGILPMDEGEIFLEGKKVDISGPLASQKMGISIIYQELNSLLNMNIAENIFLGREPKKNGVIDKKSMHEEAAKLLTHVGLNVDTRTKLSALSTAQKQMIEVAKALSFNAKLIIMDEPTSSLTEVETQTLFSIIRRLRSQGVTIIFISHRMKEIFEIADEIAIMRDGTMVCTLETAQTDENEVIGNMVGREISDMYAKTPAEIGDVMLEVRNLSTHKLLKNISFSVRKGEILGFAGLVGAGRSEVMRALFGIDPKTGGEIFINGEPVAIRNTVDAIRHDIGFLPEDRKEQALILMMSIKRNITLPALLNFRKGLFLRKSLESAAAKKHIKALDIRTPGEDQLVQNLSGGNQQKVTIGKWMEINPKLLILDEPTRGIDVKSKKEIHSLMSELAKQGVAIVMISSELPEVLGMSDRIIVMHEGRITGAVSREEATQELVMKLAIS